MGTYRGNADKVIGDAERIAERLRHTSVTLIQLKAEYRCAYPTLYKAIFSQMSKQEYQQISYQRKIRGNTATRFKKGHKTWNKNLKGLRMSPATEFKKGHLPVNHKPKGTITIRTEKNSNQVRLIKVSGKSEGGHKWVPYARYLWEQEKGPIPPGMIIAHENGNSLDDRIENFVMVDRKGNIDLMRKNNPGARNKAIKKQKQTCRRKRRERERQKNYALKIRLKKEKEHAREKRQKEIAEAGKTKLIGSICSWYECKGCGYETNHPDPPCPKCGGIAFEKIEQPLKFARNRAEMSLLLRTGT
jgi:hypothetical protein